MKTNSKKIIVSTLALAMGAALAGSISGSVAWYQYSTRASAEFQGVAAHCTENIEIRIAGVSGTEAATLGAWKNDLDFAFVSSYLTATAAKGGQERSGTSGNELRPVHAGAVAANEVAQAANFKKSPREAYTNPTDWYAASATTDYIDLPLEIRVRDVNNKTGAEAKYLAKPIYITDVTLKANAGSKDISDALRVGVLSKVGSAPTESDDYTTFAKSSADVNEFGALDLDKSGANDQTGYTFDTNRATYLYGAPTLEHASYLEPSNGDYIRYGNKLFQYSTGNAPAAATVKYDGKADLAAIKNITDGAVNDLAFELATEKFYKCTAVDSDGEKETWVEFTDYKVSEGAYAYADSKFYKCNGTAWADDAANLPVAKATGLTAVGSAVKGVATYTSSSDTFTGVALGTTLAYTGADAAANHVFVTLRIYLDGWTKIGGNAVWNEDLIGATFNVGIRFETNKHIDATE